MATSIPSYIRKIKTTIGATSTQIVEQLSASKFLSLDYTIGVKDSLHTQSKTLKLHVRNDDNINVSETVFARLGDVNISVTPRIVTGNFQLEIENKESFPVDLILTRQIT